MNNTYEEAIKAANFIKEKISIAPKIGVVLGSGLGDFANNLTDTIEIPYHDIPGFPISTVKGHSSKLVIGKYIDKNVVIMNGRFHYYEGYDMKQVTFPVRVLKLLGVEDLIITNSAGAINKKFQPGDVMLVTDHIKLFNDSPLRGENVEEFGTRFPNMYSEKSFNNLLLAEKIAKDNKIKIQKGVYAFMAGPQYETKAEVDMLRILGADAVAMSMVPEIIVARHSGIATLCISCITNAVNDSKILSHEEVLKNAEKAKEKLTTILLNFITKV